MKNYFKSFRVFLLHFILCPLFFILLPLSFILVSCNTTEPPPDNGKPKPTLSLSLDDTSPTEVWLNLTTTDLELPNEIILFRDGDTSQMITLTESDIALYEDSLLPSRTYTYQVSSNQNQATHMVTSSNEVSAVTMDTTSHNFSWEVFEFGEHGNSILRDVAIIDENNIWAVGAIYLKDSTGANDSKLYNAVHWDGSQWNLERITTDFHGNPITLSLEGIWGFSANDIWMVGSLPIHGDGENWEVIDVREITNSDLSLSRAWGTDSNNMYFVGRGGSIAHYNGTSWRKIESGTDLTMSDVYGNDLNSVYISGTDISTVTGVLLKGNQSGFSVVKNSGIIDESQLFEQLYGELSAVWIDEKGTVYTGGNILFWNRRGEWNYVTNLPENYLGGNPGVYYRGFISSIRGNSSNDYVIVGDRNTVRHYNGKSWKQLGEAYSPSSTYIWYEVVQEKDVIVAVGRNGSTAIIIKLKR